MRVSLHHRRPAVHSAEPRVRHAWSAHGGETLIELLIAIVLMGVAFAAMFSKVQGMVFGEPTVKPLAHNPALLPVFLHLGLVLMLGLWIPPYLAEWYRQAAKLIG